MPKRQKDASGSEDEFDLSDEAFIDDDDDDEPKPSKSKKPAAKKAAAGKKKKSEDGDEKEKKKKRKAPPPPPNPDVPTTYEDGFTVHPPSLIYKANPSAQGGTKIAAVDLDGTLITRKSGLAFPLDADDWKLFNSEVVSKLKQAVDDGYQLVIFSNQFGIKSALLGLTSVKIRSIMNNVLTKLAAEGIQAQALMATNKDHFRKPDTGMWDFFVANLNQGVAPNKEQSYYVGDAAGRQGDIGDNSDSDKAFAENVGLKFYTPEEYFGEAQKGPPCKNPSNAALVAAFFELGELLKAKSDFFKSKAFFNAGTAISNLEYKVESGKQLKKEKVAGVGQSSQNKIDEFLSTGKLSAIEELKGERGLIPVPMSKEAEMAMTFL